MKKLYCYVDESGQHSQGAYFLVSVVITDSDRDQLEKLLLVIELTSGKRKLKWTKSKVANRTAYVKAILTNPVFKNKLFSASYQSTREYVVLTVSTTAKSIQAYTQEEYKATVIVDGLRKSERNRFAVGLRRQGIRTNKIVGGDDTNNAFIRLADALCGFLADAQQGREDYLKLLQKAEAEGIIRLL